MHEIYFHLILISKNILEKLDENSLVVRVGIPNCLELQLSVSGRKDSELELEAVGLMLPSTTLL